MRYQKKENLDVNIQGKSDQTALMLCYCSQNVNGFNEYIYRFDPNFKELKSIKQFKLKTSDCM